MKRIITSIIVFVIFISMNNVLGQQSDRTYDIRILGKNVNNKNSNFGTRYYGPNRVIYSSPVRRNYIISNVWDGNDQPFLDLWVGDIGADGKLENIKNFSRKINTKYHEAQVCFTKDLREVYFTRNNYYKGKYVADTLGINRLQLYKAKVNSKGKWTDIVPLPFNNKDYSVGHPALSSDEKTLYFVSDKPGGYGKTDIYKVSIKGDNLYSEPENLGEKINTPGKEMFLYIEGNDLYYSSDGREDGKGGLDIYVTDLSKTGTSQVSENLINLNSEKDDFGFIINSERRDGYFSSNRIEGGYGDDDIYYFREKEKKCLQIIAGTVKDKETGRIIAGAKVRLVDNEGKEIETQNSDASGQFNFGERPCSSNYTLEGSKEKYTGVTEKISTTTEHLKTQQKDLLLTPHKFEVKDGKCLVKINPIYFDFDEYYIREDAAIELNKVIAVMKKYPELIIEGGSHTDSRGPDRYNEKLSQNRANSTVDYIIQKGGISPSRISAKGYGEYQLANGCSNGVKCTEREHQFNRRTEFVVTNIKEIQNKYPDVCGVKATSTQEQIKEGVDIKVDPKK